MIADLLSRLPPLDQHFVSCVLASCPQVRMRAAETWGEDDPMAGSLFVVSRGVVAVVADTPNGRRMVVSLATAGDIVSPPCAGRRLLALEDATLVVVTSEARQRLLGRRPVAEAIVDDLLARVREGEESLAQFGAVAHVERVRRKLLQLARLHGHRVVGGVRVELPLTHSLIAEMVGSARETVTGAVHTLEQEGFLVREGRRYHLRAD